MLMYIFFNYYEIDNIKQYSHYSGVFNKYSLNGTLHIFSSFDSWITNFSIIKFTGKNTTVPCKVIDDCLKLEVFFIFYFFLFYFLFLL